MPLSSVLLLVLKKNGLDMRALDLVFIDVVVYEY